MTSSGPCTPILFCHKAPSRLEEAELLSLRVRDLLHENGLAERCFPVELLTRECLNNAVIHGNQSDADKHILLRLRVGRVWIRLQVSDEGPGFPWREAGQRESDTTKSHGRGLRFCALYAERVRFNQSGNRITLWISREYQSRKEDL